MTNFTKSIPCPGCDNPKMEQGTIMVGQKPWLINKWCDCGFKLTIVTAENKPYEVSAKLIE